jgi:surfeit locus 1 family protein
MGMPQMQFRLAGFNFQPTWLGFLILLLCVPTFIKLGLWQLNKAHLKQEIQTSYNTALDHMAESFPQYVDNWDDWNYKKVKLSGHYETQYQILLDNQVEQSQGGFHVITPFKIEGRDDYVLINRGWVAGADNHIVTPNIQTPPGRHELIGLVWQPSKKIFTLENDVQKAHWQTVWQHMDMQRYQASVPITVLPVVIKLDAASDAGGFVRNWQLPAEKIATNMGYAYQWFGFAIASILIFLYTSTSRTEVKPD